MVGAALVAGVLWAIALALTVWILGPTVAILLGRRRIDVDVYAEPLLARPYPEDADGLRRYDAFEALGFRPVGWTSEHARFLTPLHWRWRSVEGQRWLVAPDGRSFACLYRVRKDEPIRFGAVTLLEGDGSWATYYPGADVKKGPAGNHGRVEVQGVGPAELLEQHAQYVERFRNERGLAVRTGTLADVAAATLAYERAHFSPRWAAMETSALPLGLFAFPAVFFFPRLVLGSNRASIVGAGGVIFMGLFYAAARYALLSSSHAARRTHTREFALEQTAVAPDGTITAGRYERWLRRVAVLGAVDMVARLALLAAKSLSIARAGAGPIIMAALLSFVCLLTLRDFVARVSGRGVRRFGKTSNPTGLWSGWGTLAFVFLMLTKDGKAPPHLVWFGAAAALALVGWRLEKTGRS